MDRNTQKKTLGTCSVEGFIVLWVLANDLANGVYFTASFKDLSARILITLRAGLALNICSSLVKGLIPLRAFTAGFWMATILSSPGSTKTPGPFLPTFFRARS